MKSLIILLSLVGIVSFFYTYDPIHETKRTPAAVPKSVQSLYQKFADNSFYDLKKGKEDSYEKFMNDLNSDSESRLSNNEDWIDAFIESLPPRARRHYTFVHRSYSIQSGTPMAPRVILFTPNGRTMMTFNSKLDENNEPLEGVEGGDSVEVIEWNSADKNWEFAELKLSGQKITATKNPAKCAMCHAGTPKPMVASNLGYYKNKLKPIFAQYPLWPGFYGGVNDIVGVPGTGDTIMANEADTLKHINEFLFSDSEELARLRKKLDNDERYLNVVRNEMDVHHKNFQPFIQSMKNRPRYKQLTQLSELYTENGEEVPSFLKSAPYRRSFAKKYGHYIFRPNFYLSSLMSFYQAQAVAREIINFPEYQRMKYSLLAAKFNCRSAYSLKSGDLKFTDLNPSFDLVYPNVSSQESQNRQYLLAYQYNIVNGLKSGVPHLPLFAWNLEGNEDIASYHYGNVFSDLNELVLWRLVDEAFEGIKIHRDGRAAHEDRHAELNVKNHFKREAEDTELFERALGENSSAVSRFTNSQWDFSTSPNKYYGMEGVGQKYKGLPVSRHCKKHFVPAAKKELTQLAQDKKNGKEFPHEVYSLDKKLIEIKHVPKEDIFQPIALNGTRQACEACHGNLMKPQFNADWHSDDYHKDIKTSKTPWYRNAYSGEASLKDKMLELLDPQQTLPVPFGSLMPYGRRPMDPFSLFCEQKLISNFEASLEPLPTFSDKFNCKRSPKLDQNGDVVYKPSSQNPIMEVDQSSEENIRNCQCRSLYIRKSSLSTQYFHLPKPK